MAKSVHYTKRIASALRAEQVANARATALALAPPDVTADGRTIPNDQYIENARLRSYEDPTYVQRDLDRMAEPAIQGPDGTMLGAEGGLDFFLEKWQTARPDLYAMAVLELEQEG